MVSSVDARDALSELLNRAAYGKERLVLTRRGKPLAALVPLEDLELIEEIKKRVDLEEARSALREAEVEGTTAWEQVRAELDLWPPAVVLYRIELSPRARRDLPACRPDRR